MISVQEKLSTVTIFSVHRNNKRPQNLKNKQTKKTTIFKSKVYTEPKTVMNDLTPFTVLSISFCFSKSSTMLTKFPRIAKQIGGIIFCKVGKQTYMYLVHNTSITMTIASPPLPPHAHTQTCTQYEITPHW